MKMASDDAAGSRAHRAVLTGVFASAVDLRDAVELLKEAGFRPDDMDVVMREEHPFARQSPKKEDVAAGATAGALLGGTLGWLVGVGTLVIPGIGPIIATGPLLAVVAGAGLGGAFGGMAGALKAMGIPDKDHSRYAAKLEAGHGFLIVRCDGQQKLNAARDVFVACSGRDLADTMSETLDDVTSFTPSSRQGLSVQPDLPFAESGVFPRKEHDMRP